MAEVAAFPALTRAKKLFLLRKSTSRQGKAKDNTELKLFRRRENLRTQEPEHASGPEAGQRCTASFVAFCADFDEQSQLINRDVSLLSTSMRREYQRESLALDKLTSDLLDSDVRDSEFPHVDQRDKKRCRVRMYTRKPLMKIRVGVPVKISRPKQCTKAVSQASSLAHQAVKACILQAYARLYLYRYLYSGGSSQLVAASRLACRNRCSRAFHQWRRIITQRVKLRLRCCRAQQRIERIANSRAGSRATAVVESEGKYAMAKEFYQSKLLAQSFHSWLGLFRRAEGFTHYRYLVTTPKDPMTPDGSCDRTTHARSIMTLEGYVSCSKSPPSSVPRDHAMLQDFAAYLELRLKSQNLSILRRIFADFLNEQESTLLAMLQQGCTIITIFPIERTSARRRLQAAFLLSKPKFHLDSRRCVFLYLQYRAATRNMALLKRLFLDFVCQRETSLLAFVERGCQVISVIPFELPQVAPSACSHPPSFEQCQSPQATEAEEQITSEVALETKRTRKKKAAANKTRQRQSSASTIDTTSQADTAEQQSHCIKDGRRSQDAVQTRSCAAEGAAAPDESKTVTRRQCERIRIATGADSTCSKAKKSTNMLLVSSSAAASTSKCERKLESAAVSSTVKEKTVPAKGSTSVALPGEVSKGLSPAFPDEAATSEISSTDLPDGVSTTKAFSTALPDEAAPFEVLKAALSDEAISTKALTTALPDNAVPSDEAAPTEFPSTALPDKVVSTEASSRYVPTGTPSTALPDKAVSTEVLTTPLPDKAMPTEALPLTSSDKAMPTGTPSTALPDKAVPPDEAVLIEFSSTTLPAIITSSTTLPDKAMPLEVLPTALADEVVSAEASPDKAVPTETPSTALPDEVVSTEASPDKAVPTGTPSTALPDEVVSTEASPRDVPIGTPSTALPDIVMSTEASPRDVPTGPPSAALLDEAVSTEVQPTATPDEAKLTKALPTALPDKAMPTETLPTALFNEVPTVEAFSTDALESVSIHRSERAKVASTIGSVSSKANEAIDVVRQNDTNAPAEASAFTIVAAKAPTNQALSAELLGNISSRQGKCAGVTSASGSGSNDVNQHEHSPGLTTGSTFERNAAMSLQNLVTTAVKEAETMPSEVPPASACGSAIESSISGSVTSELGISTSRQLVHVGVATSDKFNQESKASAVSISAAKPTATEGKSRVVPPQQGPASVVSVHNEALPAKTVLTNDTPTEALSSESSSIQVLSTAAPQSKAPTPVVSCSQRKRRRERDAENGKERSLKKGKPFMTKEMCRSQLELTRKMEIFEAQTPWKTVFDNLPTPFDAKKYPELARKFSQFWRKHSRAVWERKFWAPISRKLCLAGFNKRNNRQLAAKNAFESLIACVYEKFGASFFVRFDAQTSRHPGWWYRGPVVALFALQQLKGEDTMWSYVKNESLKRFPDCKLPIPLTAANSGAMRIRHQRESESMWMTNHQLTVGILREIVALKAQKQTHEQHETEEKMAER